MNRNWQKQYPKNIPFEIPSVGEKSLVELYESSCKSFNDKTAFTSMGREISYKELAELSRIFASYLQYDLAI